MEWHEVYEAFAGTICAACGSVFAPTEAVEHCPERIVAKFHQVVSHLLPPVSDF